MSSAVMYFSCNYILPSILLNYFSNKLHTYIFSENFEIEKMISYSMPPDLEEILLL